MPAPRKVVFRNDNLYHIYNRGVEKMETFTDLYEYRRAIQTIDYYRFSNPPQRFSKFLQTEQQERELMLKNMKKEGDQLVNIVAFCLMPNHFHFILQQLMDGGVQKFLANFSNSYTRYFNTRHERNGYLFQGNFKAVFVEDNEQLLHLSRYIHLNPVTASMIDINDLEQYQWSSYRSYLGKKDNIGHDFVLNNIIIEQFKPRGEYLKFIHDQADFIKSFEELCPVTIDSPQ